MSNRITLGSSGARDDGDGWVHSEDESWRPENVAMYFEDEQPHIDPPFTDILCRTDGVGLLYPGRTHSFFGPPESCKTFLALIAARDSLMREQPRSMLDPVLFLDYEDSGMDEILARLLSLGATKEALIDGLTFVQPHGPPVGKSWSRLVNEEWHWIAIVDAANGALAEMEKDGSSNSDVVAWMKSTVVPLAGSRSAAIVLDHVPLSSSRVIGAVAKTATLTGASYRVVPVAPLVPGKVGIVDLFVVKDRPGMVRRHSGPRLADRSQHAARVTFDATDPDHIVTVISPPAMGDTAPSAVERQQFDVGQQEALREQLSRFVEQAASPPSQNALATSVGGDRNDAVAQIKQLIAAGYLTIEPGRRGAHLHRSARPYRAIGSEGK